jgi:hypothetical protein
MHPAICNLYHGLVTRSPEMATETNKPDTTPAPETEPTTQPTDGDKTDQDER